MSNGIFAYSLNESFISAIFNKKPLVVVEGEDDIQFYKKIVGTKNLRILSSELIKKTDNTFYISGCEGVIQVVRDMQQLLQNDVNNIKFFLGIIDRDCRKYIDGTDFDYQGLFKLEYYSYESHFTTSNSAKNFLAYVTNVSAQYISDEIIYKIMEGMDETIKDLYYSALEALKGRCDLSYNRIVTFDTKPEELYQNNLNVRSKIEQILEKKDDLDLFAKSKSITYYNARNIIKGKWYIYAFCMTIYSNIKKLSRLCNNNDVEQCDYCKNLMFNKCIWKIKLELKRGDYVNSIINLNYKEELEIEYIRLKLKSLG